MQRNEHAVLYGLDLAKSVFQITGVSSDGRVVARKRFRRKPLIEYFSNHPRATIAMEACPGAHWMAGKLRSLGHDARIIPAQYVKPFAQRQKNDANDSLAIAEAAKRPKTRPIPIKSVHQQDLQAMHRIRDRLVNQRTRLVSQTRGLLLEYGVALRPGVGNFKRQLPEVLENADNDLTPVTRQLIQGLSEELYELEQRIDHVTRRIKAWADNDETARRLMTIPGIAALSATALIAAVGDAQQFRKGRDLAAWLGLVPRQYSTGGKSTLLGITKQGNPYLRRLLIHGARTCVLHLDRQRDRLGRWIGELSERMHINKVTVALANKLARIAWALITKSGATYRRLDPSYT